MANGQDSNSSNELSANGKAFLQHIENAMSTEAGRAELLKEMREAQLPAPTAEERRAYADQMITALQKSGTQGAMDQAMFHYIYEDLKSRGTDPSEYIELTTILMNKIPLEGLKPLLEAAFQRSFSPEMVQEVEAAADRQGVPREKVYQLWSTSLKLADGVVDPKLGPKERELVLGYGNLIRHVMDNNILKSTPEMAPEGSYLAKQKKAPITRE